MPATRAKSKPKRKSRPSPSDAAFQQLRRTNPKPIKTKAEKREAWVQWFTEYVDNRGVVSLTLATTGFSYQNLRVWREDAEFLEYEKEALENVRDNLRHEWYERSGKSDALLMKRINLLPEVREAAQKHDTVDHKHQHLIIDMTPDERIKLLDQGKAAIELLRNADGEFE